MATAAWSCILALVDVKIELKLGLGVSMSTNGKMCLAAAVALRGKDAAPHVSG